MALKISEDEDSIASLGNLGPFFTPCEKVFSDVQAELSAFPAVPLASGPVMGQH